MLEESVVTALKNQFAHVHPLVFHRSLEKSKSAGDLFDILSTVPNTCPFIWDEVGHKWKLIEDIRLSNLADELT